MIDLFLSTVFITSNQPQFLSQVSTVYLPVSTRQSSQKGCVTYTATNTTSKPVRQVYVNRRDDKGETSKYPLSSLLSDGILKSGASISFDMCDNSFVNVESKQ